MIDFILTLPRGIGGGSGYQIRRDGVVIIDQPFHPDKPGQAAMTEAEAAALAAAVIARLTAPAAATA